MIVADAEQKRSSVPRISPDTTLAGIDSTVTSWLSPFDEQSWDADAVPGLTASHGRKSSAETQNKPLPEVVDGVHHQRSLPQSTQEENISNTIITQNGFDDSTVGCVAGAPTIQSNTSSQLPTVTPEQCKTSLGTSELFLEVGPPLNYEVACRPCPAKLSASPGPRGVKRERPSTPKTSDAVTTLDGTSEHEFPWQEGRQRKWPVLKNDYSAILDGEGDLAVQTIAFSSDGSHFALACADKTLRIWNNIKRAEIARLSHNSPIVNVTWLEGDIGVVTLGEDGIVGKWTRVGGNYWQWAKIVDAGYEKGTEGKTRLAYYRDRIAVSFPKAGVKMWIWLKGTWQAQRSIVRPNVTAIKFVDDGGALLGGTRDGVLWYCEVPNGTLRAYSFLRDEITSLDMSPGSSHILVGQIGGRARLVSTRQSGNRGDVEVSYSLKEKAQAQQSEDIHSGFPGAIFAAAGQVVLFGAEDGCVVVWDRVKATVSYGLEHEKGDVIQAVSCIDGQTNRNGWIVTGTRQGQLSWWTQTTDSQKRVKTG
ncbi:WD40-repeat-containing domain protein [Amanita rubescens]|nr:WD40-repeat-containing domain protein [Amanita rubescens]